MYPHCVSVDRMVAACLWWAETRLAARKIRQLALSLSARSTFIRAAGPLVISKRPLYLIALHYASSSSTILENFYLNRPLFYIASTRNEHLSVMNRFFKNIYKNHNSLSRERESMQRTIFESKMRSRNLINNIDVPKAIVLMADRTSEIKVWIVGKNVEGKSRKKFLIR